VYRGSALSPRSGSGDAQSLTAGQTLQLSNTTNFVTIRSGLFAELQLQELFMKKKGWREPIRQRSIRQTSAGKKAKLVIQRLCTGGARPSIGPGAGARLGNQ